MVWNASIVIISASIQNAYIIRLTDLEAEDFLTKFCGEELKSGIRRMHKDEKRSGAQVERVAKLGREIPGVEEK